MVRIEQVDGPITYGAFNIVSTPLPFSRYFTVTIKTEANAIYYLPLKKQPMTTFVCYGDQSIRLLILGWGGLTLTPSKDSPELSFFKLHFPDLSQEVREISVVDSGRYELTMRIYF